MDTSTTTPALFSPIRVGEMELLHRVVLAPLTRQRATAAYVPTDLSVKYYAQRASVPGTLLISEATLIAAQAGVVPNAPGIWNDEQIEAWKKVTAAVHEKGSFIYCQLWALGRAARPPLLKAENPKFPHVAPSPIPHPDSPEHVPREMTPDEIREYVHLYATAAANAVHRAGFDGIEFHGAGGYLADQFLQDVTNVRTDEYGGSVENRGRFVLEVMEAIVAAVGQTKAAVRFSPWNTYNGMGMKNPVPTFSYVVEQLKLRFPDLAYIHTISSKTMFNSGPEEEGHAGFIYNLWAPRPTVMTGAFVRDSGIKTAEETGQLIGYGQLFIPNPDLPFRLEKDLPLNEPEGDFLKYFGGGEEGYTTYSFSEEFLLSQGGGRSAGIVQAVY